MTGSNAAPSIMWPAPRNICACFVLETSDRPHIARVLQIADGFNLTRSARPRLRKSAGCLDRRPAAKPNWHVHVHWRVVSLRPLPTRTLAASYDARSQCEAPADFRDIVAVLFALYETPAMLTFISVAESAAIGTIALMAFLATGFRHLTTIST
jgi:hypothetical protein